MNVNRLHLANKGERTSYYKIGWIWRLRVSDV